MPGQASVKIQRRTIQQMVEVMAGRCRPWCYLSTGRIEQLKREFSVNVTLVHFPLHPETPSDGITIEALFAGRDIDLEAMYSRMKSLMDAEALASLITKARSEAR